MNNPRFYHLDALRTSAMLMGVLLHATMLVVPWRETGKDDLFGLLAAFIHGFRMPLFFLLSGFFAAMLYQKSGYRGLLFHRLRRVALPLIIFWPISFGLIMGAFIFAYIIGLFPESSGESSDVGFMSDTGLMHLWFLWYLLWLTAAYVGLRRLITSLPIPPTTMGHARSVTLLALPMLSVLPQIFMPIGGFGPDTSLGLIIEWQTFSYYLAFFLFGALIFEQRDAPSSMSIDTIGGNWRFLLPISMVVLFPLAIGLTPYITPLDDSHGQRLFPGQWILASIVQICFTWAITIGLIGLYRSMLASRRFWVRYWSDASYWIYLIHLPLVFTAQAIVAILPIPDIVKYLTICVTVTIISHVTYRIFVRYTFIGTLLNGKRTRIWDKAFHDNTYP